MHKSPTRYTSVRLSVCLSVMPSQARNVEKQMRIFCNVMLQFPSNQICAPASTARTRITMVCINPRIKFFYTITSSPRPPVPGRWLVLARLHHHTLGGASRTCIWSDLKLGQYGNWDSLSYPTKKLD